MPTRNSGGRADRSGHGRPNVIIILVDDMGFSDIGCFGSEIATPNLDRLAAGGTRFTQMYNCARCCPSRASLLTGLYPHQAGIGHMAAGKPAGGRAYQGSLRDDCVTIAEVLRADGYQTFMSGKWHVGRVFLPQRPDTFVDGQPGHPRPSERGFDDYYGLLGGGASYYKPSYMAHNDRGIEPGGGGDYYLTDDFADQGVRMIDKAAKVDKPFFLYLAFNAPHWPLHALPEDMARYEGRYRKGWDELRTARHEELKGLGILDAKWDISPRDEQAPPWLEKARKWREWDDLRMAAYAAQIDRMDQGIGRILAKLRQLGLDDNTVVMFLSDNGGSAEFLAEDTSKPDPKRYKSTTFDGRPVRMGNIPYLRPGGDDTYMSYDLPWANVANCPFRRYKHWVHEGGISTPLIVHWPAGIGTEGRICHSPAHVIDIMATLVDITGAEYPGEYNGHAIQPMEGESLLGASRGQRWQRERPIFWEHEGNRAVRRGHWKMVSAFPGPWELYDMQADRTELNDLAEGDADTIKELQAAYQVWAERCGVLPWEQVRGEPRRKK